LQPFSLWNAHRGVTTRARFLRSPERQYKRDPFIIARTCRRDFKIGFMPWRFLKLMGVAVPVGSGPPYLMKKEAR
jgi:hypothetical protein